MLLQEFGAIFHRTSCVHRSVARAGEQWSLGWNATSYLPLAADVCPRLAIFPNLLPAIRSNRVAPRACISSLCMVARNHIAAPLRQTIGVLASRHDGQLRFVKHALLCFCQMRLAFDHVIDMGARAHVLEGLPDARMGRGTRTSRWCQLEIFCAADAACEWARSHRNSVGMPQTTEAGERYPKLPFGAAKAVHGTGGAQVV